MYDPIREISLHVIGKSRKDRCTGIRSPPRRNHRGKSPGKFSGEITWGNYQMEITGGKLPEENYRGEIIRRERLPGRDHRKGKNRRWEITCLTRVYPCLFIRPPSSSIAIIAHRLDLPKFSPGTETK